ncbi:LysR family transcriptional regulator [Kribbella swartbergensis]
MQLTVRVGHRVELTAAGHELARAAGDMHAALTIGVARAMEAGAPGRGHVVFGFLRSLGTTWAPRLLNSYRREFPWVGFTLVQAGHEGLLARLRDGSIDVALGVLRDTDDDVVSSRELAQEPFVVVVSDDHRLAQREHASLSDLRDEPLVGLKQGIALRTAVDQLFAASDMTPYYRLECDELETVRGLASAGLGPAVLPRRHVAPVRSSREVVITPRTYRRIGLLVSQARPTPPAAASFYNWLGEHIAGARADL